MREKATCDEKGNTANNDQSYFILILDNNKKKKLTGVISLVKKIEC